MSRWAPKDLSTESPSETELEQKPSGTPFREASGLSVFPRRVPLWLRIIPFFLSALFFLSAFFAVFSPLPLVLLGLSSKRRGRALAWLACVTNGTLVYFLGGETSLAIYAVMVLASSLALLEFLLRGKRLEVAIGGTLLAMLLTGALLVLFYSQVHHIHPWGEMKSGVSEFVDYWVKTTATQSGGSGGASPAPDPADLETWKQGLMIELPSAVGVLALILVWVNLLSVLRMNPRGVRTKMGLRPDFFQHWKAPEWLIWPTILSGATLLFDLGPVTDVGRNLFKFLMAMYAIQGLGILSFFFSYWRLKRFLRVGGYLAAVLLMMPLLLSLGFFDLWFDFRGKFRQ